MQDGKLCFVSPRFRAITGYDEDELLGREFLELVVPEDRKLAGENAAKMLKDELSSPYQLRVVRKDGGSRRVMESVSSIEYRGRLATLGCQMDISERECTEEDRMGVERRYQTALELMEEGYYEQDLAGNFTFVNDAMCRLLGYSRHELIGMNYRVYTPESDVERRYALWNKVYRTSEPERRLPLKNIRKDGTPVFVEDSVFPIQDQKGENIGFRGVAHDITERKRQEEHLMMADRLVSMGELAAGAAHELNNPLTSVIGFSRLLMEKDVPDDIRDDLAIICSEAQRASEVIKQLLRFARKHTPVKQFSQINDIIEDVLKLRAYEQRAHHIEVERELDLALPEIMVDYFQMQQVLFNIIINAEQSMMEAKSRGALAIATGRRNGTVVISVTDDGLGISEEHMGRIFNPFFTTKKVGKGTGLGLSICHRIVNEHSGQIYARSQPGQGATFFVELPINGA